MRQWSLRGGAALLGALAMVLVLTTAQANHTTVVSPGNMQGWAFDSDGGTPGSGSLVAGPGTPPLGSGSARLTAQVSAERHVLIAGAYQGTRLDQLTELEYSTYRTSGTPALAIALQFNIDADLTDANESWQGRLVFEPYYSETVLTGVWQTWDPLTQGRWWGSGAPINGTCSIGSPCTWAEVLAAFPDAGVHSTLGAVLFKAGSGWTGFDGNVDAFTIAVDGSPDVYDFEAVAPTGGCEFSVSGSTMRLVDDCETDHTILIPDGYTLDGRGHTITAVDPSGGHFVGAVVRNEGTTAHVRRLTIDTGALANVCDSGDNRLRGIMFEGASGSISRNEVRNINQGESGCQEGNAIEVRNAPFDGSHPNTQVVEISRNRVEAYQKTGIVANGDVSVTVDRNRVSGLGPIDYIAQNGIQLGFGALGTVTNNRVDGNVYTPSSFASTGILAFQPSAGVSITQNRLSANEVGIYAQAADGATISRNSSRGSVDDGIFVAASAGGEVSRNDIRDAGTNGIELNDDTSGISATGNMVRDSVEFSCRDDSTGGGTAGTANTWSRNRADTESSPLGICAVDRDDDDDDDDDEEDDDDDEERSEAPESEDDGDDDDDDDEADASD